MIEQQFREMWLVDFEFQATPGNPPRPICLVAHEMLTGRTTRLWESELHRPTPPYSTGPEALFVAYYASAELCCHLALGWPLPERVLDLYAEFRNKTNGLWLPSGRGLVGALAYFGEPTLEAAAKDSMRELALRGGPWTTEERAALLDYCESDVMALRRLMPHVRPSSRGDWGRALLRGRYMRAAAKVETRGVPIDVERLALLRARWADIQGSLIREIDRDFGVYDGNHFRADRFAQWLAARRIAWPHLPSGRLELSHDTFREMVRRYPELEPLKELRSSLSQMRLEQIAVGADGRNRTMLSAFQARTGRNQPSNTQFIFGPAVWLRRLIVPPPGFGLAYIDWSQQEFGIAAALSGDPRMLHAYSSGDPYLTFAKQAGAVPADATKESHKVERDRFKACVLAVQYGMGRDALALRIGCTPTEARELLQAHREAYARFWGWSDGAVDVAMFTGRLWTVFGWQVSVSSNTNARSLRNFPMQANGAEMLRLACCHITEAGIGLCAPIHDAVLVEAPAHDLGRAVAGTQEAMAQASEEVLGGFRLRTDVKAVMHPARYSDERGERMWKAVEAALDGTGPWTGAPKDPGVHADPANLLSLCSS